MGSCSACKAANCGRTGRQFTGTVFRSSDRTQRVAIRSTRTGSAARLSRTGALRAWAPTQASRVRRLIRCAGNPKDICNPVVGGRVLPLPQGRRSHTSPWAASYRRRRCTAIQKSSRRVRFQNTVLARAPRVERGGRSSASAVRGAVRRHPPEAMRPAQPPIGVGVGVAAAALVGGGQVSRARRGPGAIPHRVWGVKVAETLIAGKTATWWPARHSTSSACVRVIGTCTHSPLWRTQLPGGRRASSSFRRFIACKACSEL